jgi:hypothetical protein
VTQSEDNQKLGTCSWCGKEATPIFAENEYCEECDVNVTHCAVCDADCHADDPCRHVFLDENYDWQGSGIGDPGDNIKKSFQLLLKLMGRIFATDIRHAIAGGRFYTWLMAPLIGSGGTLSLYGIEDVLSEHGYGEQLIKLGQGEQADELSDGYHWMASLYKNDTNEANNITISWIDAFLKEPV